MRGEAFPLVAWSKATLNKKARCSKYKMVCESRLLVQLKLFRGSPVTHWSYKGDMTWRAQGMKGPHLTRADSTNCPTRPIASVH
jgi:hypothetical protein